MQRAKRLQSGLQQEASGSEPEERDSFPSSTGVLLSGQEEICGSGAQRRSLRSPVTKSSLDNFRSGGQAAAGQSAGSVQEPASRYQQPQFSDSIRSQTSGLESAKGADESARLIEDSNESSSSSAREYCCCCCGKPTRMTRAASYIMACFAAELIGTFILVIIGDGVIATYVLNKQHVNVFVACFAFGVGAMIATFATHKISGAHINPAASVAFALDGRIKWRMLPVYLCAQYLGGFLAALVLFVNNGEAIDALDGGARSAFGSANSTGHIFATYPGAWVSVWGSLLDQTIGTAVLLFSQCAIGDKHNLGLEDRHQPFIVSLVIGLTCVAFNVNCGAIFNPARDLAPRILTALVGYPNVWAPTRGLYWLTAGVLGPHIGAVLGVFAYRLAIGGALVAKRKHELENQSLEAKQQQGQQKLTKLAGRQRDSVELSYGSSIGHHGG